MSFFNRKPLFKQSQAPVLVMVSPEIRKFNLWSNLSEERHEKPQKFHENSFRSRIKSINSAVKKSLNVKLKACSGLFHGKLFLGVYFFRNMPFDG